MCVGGCVVHFAGLRDNYSIDHLFSGMRWNNKRSRVNIQLRRRREGDGGKRKRDGGLEDNQAGPKYLIN